MDNKETLSKALLLNTFIHNCNDINKELNTTLDFNLMTNLNIIECKFKTNKMNIAKLEIKMNDINNIEMTIFSNGLKDTFKLKHIVNDKTILQTILLMRMATDNMKDKMQRYL